MRVHGVFGVMAAVLLLSGCASKPRDYAALREHMPRSVLVLPPLNASLDIKATYSVLSTVTRPLAEMGYYVYPVVVIDQFMKENGLPTAGEMHQVPLNKLREIIGADAVLYISIVEYGTKYVVLNSATVVRLKARLVDIGTGNLLWTGHANVQVDSNSGGGGLIGALVSSAVNQVVASSTDQAHGLTVQANTELFTRRGQGLLYGPLHPRFGQDSK